MENVETKNFESHWRHELGSPEITLCKFDVEGFEAHSRTVRWFISISGATITVLTLGFSFRILGIFGPTTGLAFIGSHPLGRVKPSTTPKQTNGLGEHPIFLQSIGASQAESGSSIFGSTACSPSKAHGA